MSNIEIERELSYCFSKEHSVEDIADYFKEHIFNTSIECIDIITITDHYLSENMRARFQVNSNKEVIRSILTKKTGDKADVREEHHADLSAESSVLLKEQSKLTVNKYRYIYRIVGKDNIKFTIDDVQLPMQLKIVELECDSDRTLQDLRDAIPFKNNIESTWYYFKKKIAFAGGPSSGKSTLTRQLVNDLAVKYNLQVEQVTEYARTHISRFGVPPWVLQPVLEWSQEQREKDAEYSSTIVTDSPRFLAYIYGLMNYHAKLDKSAIFLFTRLYEGALKSLLDYSNIILLEQPKHLVEDGIRCQTSDEARKVYHYIQNFLDQHNYKYISWKREKNLDDLILQIFKLNKIDGKV